MMLAPGIVAAQVSAVEAGPVPEFVQAGSVYRQTSAQETHTFAYAAGPAADDRLLALMFFAKVNSNFSAQTYNGIGLSQGVLANNTATTPDIRCGCYYMLDSDIPTDESNHNFDFDWPTTTSGGLSAQALEYVNVAQTTPAQSGNGNGNDSVASVAFTGVGVGSLLLDVLGASQTDETSTHGANQNERGDDQGTAQHFSCSDKLPADHAGGNVSMSVAKLVSGSPNSSNLCYAAIEFSAA